MKHCIFLLCVILFNNYSWSQEFPKGTWMIVIDNKGNALDIKNPANGAHQVTSFDFQEGVKYSFSFEEYDSAGRKTMMVKEYGVYSVTSSQFVLTPAASTTSFYDYIPQSNKPIGNSVKQNPLTAGAYRWIYQREKEEKLTVEALNPGHREGLFTGTKSRTTSLMPRRKELSAVRSTVRSL